MAFFNFERLLIEDSTIRAELLKLGGRRVFHPYRKQFRLDPPEAREGTPAK